MEKDYSDLLSLIILKFSSRKKFAEAMQMSLASLIAKLKNNGSFTQKEIEKACDLLEIPYEQIPQYFFKYLV